MTVSKIAGFRDRRDFLKTSGAVICSATWANVAIGSPERLSPSDPTAIALKYVEDASSAIRSDKMSVSGSNQFCNNCALYAGLETAETAPCAIFQNKLVVGTGWCAAWILKGG